MTARRPPSRDSGSVDSGPRDSRSRDSRTRDSRSRASRSPTSRSRKEHPKCRASPTRARKRAGSIRKDMTPEVARPDAKPMTLLPPDAQRPTNAPPEAQLDDYDEAQDFLGAPLASAELRERLDREREALEARYADKPFWLVCPKCGTRLVTREIDQVRAEYCPGCNGIYFDDAEARLLLEMSAQDRALARRMRGFLR